MEQSCLETLGTDLLSYCFSQFEVDMERLKQCTRKRIGRKEGSGDWRGSLSPARIKSTQLGIQELEVTGEKKKKKKIL